MRHLYQQGIQVGTPIDIVGADEPSMPEFQKAAREIAKGHASQHLAIALLRQKNQAGLNVAQVFGFDTAKQAAEKFDQLATKPGDAVYVSLFDKTQKDLADQDFIKDEAMFVAVQEVHTHTKVLRKTTKQSALGWALAGVAGLAGVVALGRRKGGGR